MWEWPSWSWWYTHRIWMDKKRYALSKQQTWMVICRVHCHKIISNMMIGKVHIWISSTNTLFLFILILGASDCRTGFKWFCLEDQVFDTSTVIHHLNLSWCGNTVQPHFFLFFIRCAACQFELNVCSVCLLLCQMCGICHSRGQNYFDMTVNFWNNILAWIKNIDSNFSFTITVNLVNSNHLVLHAD